MIIISKLMISDAINDDHDDIEGDHYEEIDPGDHDEQVDHVDVKGDHDEQVDFDDVKGDHDEQGQHRQLSGRRAAAAPWTGDHQVLLIKRGLDKSMMIIGPLHWPLVRNYLIKIVLSR